MEAKEERMTFSGPDGEVTLPRIRDGKFINFTVVFDVHRDWRIIQLIYSLPARERSRTVKNLLTMVVNAAALASERQPILAMKIKGKKLSADQVKKRLRSAFKSTM